MENILITGISGQDGVFLTSEILKNNPTHNIYGITRQKNKEVFFGIRPEHIFSKKSNEGDFEINLRADLSEYIGHEQIMTFDYANQEVLAKFPSTIKIDLGKETKLYFDLTQASLFDAQTEERI